MYGARELAESFRTVRTNTIQIAEEIPEDKYAFRAAPEVMSVGQMLAHLAVTPRWQIELHTDRIPAVDFALFSQRLAASKAQEQALQTKDHIVGALKEGAEQLTAFMAKLTPEVLQEMVSSRLRFSRRRRRVLKCCSESRSTRCTTAAS